MLPPRRLEASRRVIETGASISRARAAAAAAAERPVMPPPTMTIRVLCTLRPASPIEQEGRRDRRKHFDEVVVGVERSGPRIREAAGCSHGARFDVEVVEYLDMIGQKADGGKDRTTVSPRAHHVEGRRNVGAQPRIGPARPGQALALKGHLEPNALLRS